MGNEMDDKMTSQALQSSATKLKLHDLLFACILLINVAIPNIVPPMVRAVSILIFEAYTLLTSLGRKGNATIQVVWGIMFFAWALLSITWAQYPQSVNEQLMNIFWSIGLNITIARFVYLYDIKIEYLYKMAILCIILLFINTILFGFFDSNDSRLDIGINENVYGMSVSNLGCIILLSYRNNKKLINWVFLLLIIVLVFLSGSRKALLSVVFYIIYILNANKGKIRPKNILIFLSVTALFYFIIMEVDFFYNIIGYRISGILNYFITGEAQEGSLYSRLNMARLALEYFKESPIIGHGLNSFKYHVYYYTYSHNNYTELLSGVGIIGLIIYYVPMLVIYIKSFAVRKKYPEDSIIPIAFLTMLFVLDVGNVSYFLVSNHVFLGIAIGYYYKMISREQEINMTRNETKWKIK